jgi:hypothetical protein
VKKQNNDRKNGKIMDKIAVIYYSLKGETIAPGMKIVNLEKGHTAVAAEFVQKAVGGELIELDTIKTYLKDHMKMIYEAKEELENGIRPELKKYPDIITDIKDGKFMDMSMEEFEEKRKKWVKEIRETAHPMLRIVKAIRI